MNFVSKARTTAIATIAAIGLIAGSAAVAPTAAQAGNNYFANGLIGGLIVGGIVAASQKNYYGGGYVAPAPVYQSCYTQWETRYNSYGQPYSVKIKYCN